MVVLGTTIHEFACDNAFLLFETRGWSADECRLAPTDQVRPWRSGWGTSFRARRCGAI